MAPNVLILGGTTEASALAQAVAAAGLRGCVSFAGRVARPVRQPLPQRVGGFGGPAGLAAYLQREGVTHLVDATHPFAARMACNAVEAARAANVPMIALTRPAWRPAEGDQWHGVPDMDGAVDALAVPRKRVMLAVGRMHLAMFASVAQHFYLLRLVDPPDVPLPLPDTHVEVSRGPFTVEEDRALMERHGIELVVSKNAGGTGARAKLDAARMLGLPVLMIDRPASPVRTEVSTVADAMAWISSV